MRPTAALNSIVYLNRTGAVARSSQMIGMEQKQLAAEDYDELP